MCIRDRDLFASREFKCVLLHQWCVLAMCKNISGDRVTSESVAWPASSYHCRWIINVYYSLRLLRNASRCYGSLIGLHEPCWCQTGVDCARLWMHLNCIILYIIEDLPVCMYVTVSNRLLNLAIRRDKTLHDEGVNASDADNCQQSHIDLRSIIIISHFFKFRSATYRMLLQCRHSHLHTTVPHNTHSLINNLVSK